jgi:hypothetical protein
VAAGLSLENPQQYVGGAVVLPASFNAAQVDVAGNTATPNPYPDVIGKLAFDPIVGGRRQHIEVAGIVRGYKTYNSATSNAATATGRGASVNAVLEPLRSVRVVATSFVSDGGGRYIFGLGPDFIVDADGRPSLVGASSGILGAEVQAASKTLLFGYYGMARFDQNVVSDPAGRALGFGVANASGANHKIDESTVGVIQTFFREPRYGALQLITQYSYLTREPWSVPAGTPGRAKSHMVWVNVRYVLP